MDKTTLEMALIGYEAERQRVQQKIAEIQSQLNGRFRRSTTSATPQASGRRTMSTAARKRIAAAQKKRWAAFHRKQKAAK